MKSSIRRSGRLALAFFTALAMVMALAPIAGADHIPDTGTVPENCFEVQAGDLGSATIDGVSISLTDWIMVEGEHRGFEFTVSGLSAGQRVDFSVKVGEAGEGPYEGSVDTDGSHSYTLPDSETTEISHVRFCVFDEIVSDVNIEKTASETVVDPGTEVTYTYVVTNPGDDALADVTVTDDKCESVTFVDGDTNEDGLLDTDETWTFECTTTIDEDTLNTATATGVGAESGDTVSDTDTAEVTVIVEVTSDINIEKTASETVVDPGTEVTYTYVVTNPGDDALADVTVTDDKCESVTFVDGDTNEDGLLDTDETWTFECTTTIDEDTLNTATATGVGAESGDTVSDTGTAEVTVVVPGALTVLIDKTNDADEDGTFTDEETATVPADVDGLVADVDFRAVITNTSDVSVTITELTDSFGTTTINICPSLVGTTLSPGQSVVCDFTVDDYTPVSNGSTTNTASVTVVDEGERTASDEDDSIVHFVKVAATPISLTVVKTNDANQDGVFTNEETASVPADRATLSADVTFRAVITNDGTTDVQLSSLTDQFGTTTISICDNLIGTVLAPGTSVTCTFTVQDYAPASGASQVNTVLVEGVDPQVSDNTAAAQDTSTVNFARVLQTEQTTTTPATLPFTGGDGPTGALGALAAALVALGGLILAMARGRERRHRRRVS